MLQRKSALLSLLFAAMVLSACGTGKTATPNIHGNTQTGYWYLGEGGKQEWRTYDTANTPPPAPAVEKKYAPAIGQR